MVSNTHEMAQFLKRTLCHIQLHKNKDVDLTAEANSCLKGLIDDGYISQKVSTEGILKLDVTKLGRAIFKGFIVYVYLNNKLFIVIPNQMAKAPFTRIDWWFNWLADYLLFVSISTLPKIVVLTHSKHTFRRTICTF